MYLVNSWRCSSASSSSFLFSNLLQRVLHCRSTSFISFFSERTSSRRVFTSPAARSIAFACLLVMSFILACSLAVSCLDSASCWFRSSAVASNPSSTSSSSSSSCPSNFLFLVMLVLLLGMVLGMVHPSRVPHETARDLLLGPSLSGPSVWPASWTTSSSVSPVAVGAVVAVSLICRALSSSIVSLI